MPVCNFHSLRFVCPGRGRCRAFLPRPTAFLSFLRNFLATKTCCYMQAYMQTVMHKRRIDSLYLKTLGLHGTLHLLMNIVASHMGCSLIP